jgi:hypothetical protein
VDTPADGVVGLARKRDGVAVCRHRAGTIGASHWSCCGEQSEAGACVAGSVLLPTASATTFEAAHVVFDWLPLAALVGRPGSEVQFVAPPSLLFFECREVDAAPHAWMLCSRQGKSKREPKR